MSDLTIQNECVQGPARSFFGSSVTSVRGSTCSVLLSAQFQSASLKETHRGESHFHNILKEYHNILKEYIIQIAISVQVFFRAPRVIRRVGLLGLLVSPVSISWLEGNSPGRVTVLRYPR